MKRKIALILAAMMMLTMLPITAFAANDDKLIALTFDDGPSDYTQKLLDGLRERGVKCTFFVLGRYAVDRPELIKQMWYDGHQVASHTYDHPQLTDLSDAEIRSQLDRTDAVLDKAIGFDQDYMLRPPYGEHDDRVLKTANVPCFYWSMDTKDWEVRDVDAVYASFLSKARDGSLALLHDSVSTTVDASLKIVDYYLEQGYEFVTVAELFYRRGKQPRDGHIYYSAYPGSYGTADGIAEPVVSSVKTDAGRQVTVKGDSRGSVYYTTNGEYPTPVNSRLYTGPFTVNDNTTVKAVSVLSWNGLRSDVTTAEVEYGLAQTPVISLGHGMITMTCNTPDSRIYYTADGTAPDKKATRYKGSFKAVPGTTYRARAYASGYDASVISMLTYSNNGNIFNDVAVGSWYYRCVDRAVSEELFVGYPDGSFRPENNFTRAMMVAVLYRMQGSPKVRGMKTPFGDVSEDHWAYDSIAWAYNNGIVVGYPNGSFKPDKMLSREELCMMLANYIRSENKDIGSVVLSGLAKYSDAKRISQPMQKSVDLVSSLGIVCGNEDGTLKPQSGATRAEAASMLVRMEDALPKIPDLPHK